jgi:hypothetical protein
VYLLTGCAEVWVAVRPAVLAERSISPVGRRARQPTPSVVLQRAPGHGVGRSLLGCRPLAGKFPYVFEQFYCYRWVVACHLSKHIPPALTVTERLA